MSSTTLLATWIALAKGFSTESTCDDEVVLLQHSYKNVVRTKRGGSSMGPDENGLCNWGSVFGAYVPDDVAGVQDMLVTSCTLLYSASFCVPMAVEIFNVFDNTIPFDDQTYDHPFFCEEITELIVASAQHQRELSPDMALLGKVASSALLSRTLVSTKPSGDKFEKVLQSKIEGGIHDTRGGPEDEWAAAFEAAFPEAFAPSTPAPSTPAPSTPAPSTPAPARPSPHTGCLESTGVPDDRPSDKCTPCTPGGTRGCDREPCKYDSPEDVRCGQRRRRLLPR